jgi:ABC-type transport system substrate-binding protein
VLLTLVVGCTAPPARESFVLRVAMWGPLGELAPIGGNESALASVAQPWVFEKLITLDAGGQPKPALAARFERLSGERVRVELRHDATFSDGKPVTEDDVVRSLQAGGLQVTQSEGTLIVARRE